MKNLNLQTKSNSPYLIRKLLVMMFLALLWVANVRAEYSSNGWVFTIQGDGTACVNYPVRLIWTPVPNYNYSTYSYERRIESSISIPSSVTVQTFQWDAEHTMYVEVSGKTYLVTAFNGSYFSAEQKAAVTSATIPAYITTLAWDAFYGFSALGEITIPATVTTMGDRVFSGCTGMKKATILNPIIANQQFNGCTSLEEVTLSDNLTTIGPLAFINCNSLKAIEIPASVTSWSGCFNGCTGLKDVTVKAKIIPNSMFYTLPIETLTLDGVEEIGSAAFNDCKKLTTADLGNALIKLGGTSNTVFRGCESLLEITIPATVTHVENQAFSGCTAMKKATILNPIIANQQFYGCTSLEEVTLSDNLTTIGPLAFNNCNSLRAIEIPASVTSWSGCFGGCTGLKDVTVKAKIIPNSMFYTLPIETLTLDGVEEIGSGAFSGCKKLTTADLGNALIKLGGTSNTVFRGCESLLEITIPATVIHVENEAFSGCKAMKKATILNPIIGYQQFAGCTSLEEIILSDNVTTIGTIAFNNCSAMKKLTVGWNMPLPLYDSSTGRGVVQSAFSGITVSNVSLNVPPGTESLYKVADVWKNFNIRIAVTGISLSNEYLALKVDSTYRLTARVVPENADNKGITWSSSNTGVATVSAEGLVTGIAPGTAIITATTGEGEFSKACTVTVTSNTVPVTGISLNRESLALKVDSTAQLTASVQPGNATDQSVTWSSDKTGIATVSPAGLVTGVAPGAAVITATTGDGGFTISCTVTVTANPVPEIHVTGVALDKTSIELKASSTAQLTATVQPANAGNQSVTWSSSNESAATVSREGLVIALAAGSATITVTTADGGFTATCEVTVTPNTDALTIAPSTLAAAAGSKEGSPVTLTLTLKAGNENIPVEAGAKLTITAAGLDFSTVSLPNGYTAVTKQNGKLVFSFNAAATLTGAGTAIELAGIVPAGTTSGTVVVNLEREGQAALTKTFAELTFAPLTIDDFELALSLSSDQWTAPVSGILATPVTVTATVLSKATGQTAANIAGTLKMSLTDNAYVSLNGYSSLDITIANGQGTVTVTKINAYVRFGEALQYKLFAGGELAKTSGSESSGTLSAEKPVTLTAQTRYLTGRIGIDSDGDFNPANDAPFGNALVTLTVPAHTATVDGRTVAHPEMNISARTDAQGNYSIALPTPHEGCGDDLQQATLTVSGDETRHISERNVPVAAANSGTAGEPVVNFSAQKYVQLELFLYSHATALEAVTDYPSLRSEGNRVVDDNQYIARLEFAGGKIALLSNYIHVAGNVWRIPQSVLAQGTANGATPANVAFLAYDRLSATSLHGTVKTFNYDEAANNYKLYVDIKPKAFVEIINIAEDGGQSSADGISARIFYRRQGVQSWTNAGIYYVFPGQRVTYGKFDQPTEIVAIMVNNLATHVISQGISAAYLDSKTGAWSVPNAAENSYIIRQKTLDYGTKLSISETPPHFDIEDYKDFPRNIQANFLGIKGNTAAVSFSFTASDSADLELGNIQYAIDEGLVDNTTEGTRYSVLPDGRKVIINNGYNNGLWTGHMGGIVVSGSGGNFTKLKKGETVATIICFDLKNPGDAEALHSVTFSYQAYSGGRPLLDYHTPVASVSFHSVPNLTMEGQNYTDTSYVTVSGKAAPGAEVALAVNGSPAETVKANKAGQWTADVSLFDVRSEYGAIFVVTATSDGREAAPLAVTYSPGIPKILGFGDLTHRVMLITRPRADGKDAASYYRTSDLMNGWATDNGKYSTYFDLDYRPYPETVHTSTQVAFMRITGIREPVSLNREGAWQWTERNKAILRYVPGEELEYKIIFDQGNGAVSFGQGNDAISNVWVNISNAVDGGKLAIPAEYELSPIDGEVWTAKGKLPETGFAPDRISVSYSLAISDEMDIVIDKEFNVPMLDGDAHIEIVKNSMESIVIPEETKSTTAYEDFVAEIHESIPELASSVAEKNPVTGKYNISFNINGYTMRYYDCYMEFFDRDEPGIKAASDALLTSASALPLGRQGAYGDYTTVTYTKGGIPVAIELSEFLKWVSNYENFTTWAIANGIDEMLQYDITQVIHFVSDESVSASPLRAASANQAAKTDHYGYVKFGFKVGTTAHDYCTKDNATSSAFKKGGGYIFKAIDAVNLKKKWDKATNLSKAWQDIRKQRDKLNNMRYSNCGAKMSEANGKAFDVLMEMFDDMEQRAWNYSNSNTAIQFVSGGISVAMITNDIGKDIVEYFAKKAGKDIAKKIALEKFLPDLVGIGVNYFDAKNSIKGYDDQIKAVKSWLKSMKNYEKSLQAIILKDCQEWYDKNLPQFEINVREDLVKSSFDPSGFAYEDGDLTKFVSDVHAEVWQADDASGANARIWDEAAEYGEVNPQTTGVDGWYAWDVPIGWWQVRLSKEGYEDAHSEWLRVIPPQLGINLEMKRSGTGILLPAGSGNTLSVYPNPTKGELRIANYELRKGDKVTVASLTGQTVAAYTWPFAVVDISHLPAGIYIVTVEGGNGISRAKVVKQ